MKNLLLIGLLFFAGCTKNERAKNYGGNASIELPENQKLINVTWKDDDLWYLTRPMVSSDIAETYTFKEKSSYGVWQGSYTVIEKKNIPEPTKQVKIHLTEDDFKNLKK